MEAETHPPLWKTLLAFAILYIVWGSTYLAIRVGVQEVPPLLFAAMRFLFAGLLLYGWVMVRGERLPKGRQWSSICLLALLYFVLDYGFLFWAEQRVPSGPAAVMMATIPVFIALSEIVILRTQRMTLRLAAALLIGIGGVGVLVSRSLNLSGAPIDRMGVLAMMLGAFCWSIGTVLSRRLPLPESRTVNSAAQMLAGGAMLTAAAAAFGEFQRLHPREVSAEAWWALLYLVVAGSILGFTAYVWLIHHESPTKVGTYAYVNPVVAVVLGYFLAGETVGLRTVLGTLFVLVSVVMITTARKPAR